MSLTTSEPRLVAATESNTVATRVLLELERAGLEYCVLRGGDQVVQGIDDEEVDLLVAPQHWVRLCNLLSKLGFARLRAWGHAPHHFFVVYDDGSDRWLKLDVVTQIAYGRPTHELHTDLAAGCLANRQRWGSIYIPAPENELVTLLLHCVVDKGEFPTHWRRRITDLCDQVSDEKYVNEMLSENWASPLTFQDLNVLVHESQWDTILMSRRAVERRLTMRQPFRGVLIRYRDIALRKLNHLVSLLRPSPLSVAILAPDGAGKSTLAAGVREHFYFPVDQIYMGLYQRSGTPQESRVWGLGFLQKVMTQWLRYWQGYLHRARGRFVIFDRYSYDALLPGRNKLSRIQRVRRWLLANTCPAPDLILMLDAPGEILFARKGEHSAEYLEQHRQAYLTLKRRFPQMVVVDAARDAESVRRMAMRHIWHGFAKRLRHHRDSN